MSHLEPDYLRPVQGVDILCFTGFMLMWEFVDQGVWCLFCNADTYSVSIIMYDHRYQYSHYHDSHDYYIYIYICAVVLHFDCSSIRLGVI